DHLEQLPQPETRAQRLVGRRLHRRAVHHWIGIRQADLDDVEAAVDHRGQQLLLAIKRRVAGGQVADQRGTTLRSRAGEHRFQAGREAYPKYLAAVSMSLSPRPDRFTRIMPSSPSSLPSLMAPASACADSIAGMMPSVRDTSWNACIASSSVTAVYSALPVSFSHECSGPTPG